MSREIKFRAWDGLRMTTTGIQFNNSTGELVFIPKGKLMQFTGLKDKNGLEDIYEGDIIDVNGLKKGNVYENEQEATDLVIEGFGTKTWVSTYQEAMERGCKNAE